MTYTSQMTGLPDPKMDADYYDGVPMRRAIAWVVDAIIIFVGSLIVVGFLGLLTFGVAFFFGGLLALVASFAYRVIFIANRSATPGMMLMGIEFRTFSGQRFSLVEALVHTTLFMLLFASFFGQIASIITMTTTNYGRSLPDFVLGSTVINRSLD